MGEGGAHSRSKGTRLGEAGGQESQMVWLQEEQQSRLICAQPGLGAAGSLEGEPQEIRPAELLTGRRAGCRSLASTFPATSPLAAHQAQERWGKQLPGARAKGRGPSHSPRRGRQLTKSQRERWGCCRLQGLAPGLREPGKHWQEWREEGGCPWHRAMAWGPAGQGPDADPRPVLRPPTCRPVLSE